MSDINLTSNDYLAIAKSLDTNKNNIVEASEATIVKKGAVGNNNNTLGTVELANALAKGDAFVQKASKPAADNVADFFSDRKTNLGKNPNAFTRDGWLSREDLPMSDRMRSNVDVNKDNKVSANEFSDALASGKMTIGTSIDLNEGTPSQASNPFASKPAIPANSDPFGSKPQTQTKPSVNGDPFASSKPAQSNSSSDPFASKPAIPANSDPFGNKPQTQTKPSVNGDPFSNKPTQNPVNSDPFSNKPVSGNKPVNGDPFSNKPTQNPVNSDPFSNKPVSGNKPMNSPFDDPFNVPYSQDRDSGAFAEIDAIKKLYNEGQKSSMLKEIATRPNLSTREQIMVADSVTGLFNDSAKAEILNTLASNRYLSDDAAKSVIKRTDSLYNEASKLGVLKTVASQRISPETQMQLVDKSSSFFNETAKYDSKVFASFTTQ
ncbi:MAG: hypothetical protein ACK4IX_02935, partial [Candidatus Sericytochromatia bacterium]